MYKGRPSGDHLSADMDISVRAGGGLDADGMAEQVIDDVPNDFTCHCHCYNLVNLISI